MNATTKLELKKLAGIEPAAVDAARRVAAASGSGVIAVLEEQSGLGPAAFTSALAHTLHLAVISMVELRELEPAFDLLPYTEALQHRCALLRSADSTLIMAFADPFDDTLRPWAEERIRDTPRWVLANPADIAALLAVHEETMRAMDGMLPAAGQVAAADLAASDLSLQSISADTSSVVKLVNSTIYDALKTGASDIHLETGGDTLGIKYRIDGVLLAIGTVAGRETAEQVISRIKVMAELDIAERRIPQDGRFRISQRGRAIDFRVSIMPSIHGEDAVLRILDKQALTDQVRGLRLDFLGFNPEVMRKMRRLSAEPYGMFLVTGPTGSGKTTTLYAAVSEINHGRDKIITIEDPVEYQLPGVLQIPVNEKKGLTFARGLRSILRHDPDKIMVGEIRDPETAQIAVQAALTGHLVFTTVHANNVFDVLGRFTHMGIDAYSLVAALNGILAQRLIRLNCPQCSEHRAPTEAQLSEAGLAPERVHDFDFRAGRGCGHCRGSGYKGRRAIAELLLFTDEMRERIAARAPLRELKELALAGGTCFLREAAVQLVREGTTTLEEINRVTVVA
ncbi:MAG: type secretion system protein [Betaproteobacteria bacterium]|nr:type secretion system protein [Betaproteobacteria bacterium]